MAIPPPPRRCTTRCSATNFSTTPTGSTSPAAPPSPWWPTMASAPAIRTGGSVFGLPSGEHERYAGKRGTGVVPPPGSLAKMCPDGAPNCQASPNGGLAAPTLGSVRKRAGELIVQGELRGKPLSRFTVEIFGHPAAGSGQGEMVLGQGAATSDAEGRGRISPTVPPPQ